MKDTTAIVTVLVTVLVVLAIWGVVYTTTEHLKDTAAIDAGYTQCSIEGLRGVHWCK